jgi:hypothetical protein
MVSTAIPALARVMLQFPDVCGETGVVCGSSTFDF